MFRLKEAMVSDGDFISQTYIFLLLDLNMTDPVTY